jgi:hypothetical protein
VKETARSLAHIERNDLLRLAELAAQAEAGLFTRHPDGAGRYTGRLLCRALCQGAALHYLDGKNGVKDFDVWSFYADLGDGPFPYRWRGTADFGPSRFGRYPGDPPSYAGRRVELLGRSLPAPPGADPAAVLRDYLSAARTASAKAAGSGFKSLAIAELGFHEFSWNWSAGGAPLLTCDFIGSSCSVYARFVPFFCLCRLRARSAVGCWRPESGPIGLDQPYEHFRRGYAAR